MMMIGGLSCVEEGITGRNAVMLIMVVIAYAEMVMAHGVEMETRCVVARLMARLLHMITVAHVNPSPSPASPSVCR